MAFIIEDDEQPKSPQPQGRFVIEGDSTGMKEATSPSRTPSTNKAGLIPQLLEGAVSGTIEGVGNLATGVKALGQAIAQTPSDIAYMAQNPREIPRILRQTGENTVRMVTDPKSIAAGLGGAVGGPGGAAAGAGIYQMLHDLTRQAMGETVTPKESASGLMESLTTFGGPPAVGTAVPKAVGGLTRFGAKAFPGSAVALQKDVLDKARQTVAGVPRPPVPPSAEELAATRGSAVANAEAENAARMAAYQSRLKQSQAAGVSRIREAGMLPYVEKPYAELEAMGQSMNELLGGAGMATKQGILRETVPVPNVVTALSKEAENLAPLIEKWKVSANPTLQKSAAALEKHLNEATGMTLGLDQVIRLMQDLGPITTRGGRPGGAANQIYKAAIADLEAHGSDAALMARKAAFDYRRQVGVKTLQDWLARSVKSKGGELVPSPDALIRVLQSPSSRAEKHFVKRLRDTLTTEEQSNLLADLKGAIQNLPAKPEKVTVPPQGSAPKRITSLQEVLESAKEPVGGGTNVNLDKVLKQLPSQGAEAGTESALAEFLRQNMSPGDISALEGELRKLSGVKKITTGAPSFLERLPVYTTLAPLLSLLGISTAGAGGGAAAATVGGSILLSEAATQGLKRLAATPRMQQALLRAYKNRIGDMGSSLGGPALGMVSEGVPKEPAASRRKRRTR